MTLGAALCILCDVHLNDYDDDSKWAVCMGAIPSRTYRWSDTEYVQAWDVIRQHLLSSRSDAPTTRS